MAFEAQDFNRHFVKRGNFRGLFNVARSDEANDSPRYYAYINEDGSYFIQRIVKTADVGVYNYYANPTVSTLNTNWANRASLDYKEYNQLF